MLTDLYQAGRGLGIKTVWAEAMGPDQGSVDHQVGIAGLIGSDRRGVTADDAEFRAVDQAGAGQPLLERCPGLGGACLLLLLVAVLLNQYKAVKPVAQL